MYSAVEPDNWHADQRSALDSLFAAVIQASLDPDRHHVIDSSMCAIAKSGFPIQPRLAAIQKTQNGRTGVAIPDSATEKRRDSNGLQAALQPGATDDVLKAAVNRIGCRWRRLYRDSIGSPAINGCERHSRFRSTLPRETANEASRTVLVSSIYCAARHGNARQFRTCC